MEEKTHKLDVDSIFLINKNYYVPFNWIVYYLKDFHYKNPQEGYF